MAARLKTLLFGLGFMLMAFSALAASSAIFDAPEIVDVVISKARPGTWRDTGDQERQRQVSLELSIEHVLKGSLRTGGTAHVEVIQFESTGRFHAVPGAWSGKSVDKGRHYIVFAKDATLHDQSLLRVTDDKSALTDVELVLSFEKDARPIADLAKRIDRKRRGSLGPLFAEYLKACLPKAAQGKAEDWEAILRFIEEPELSAGFRSLASEATIEALLSNSPAPESHVVPTTVGAFRLLAMPDANGLHNRLLQTELPNLLGWEGSEPKRSAEKVFRAYPKDRPASEKSLRLLPPSPERDRLLDWMHR